MIKNKEILNCTETKLRVRYGETDQMGYCYYGNYAQYFEVGRVAALGRYGMSYKELENRGYMLPVSDYTVKYIRPAFYDDLLTVKTKIIQLKGVRIYFEYEIFNENSQLIATAETTLVFINSQSRKPVAPPEDFVSLIHNLKE